MRPVRVSAVAAASIRARSTCCATVPRSRTWAADGNDGRRGVDPIRIRLVAQLLNVDLYPADQDVEKITPVRRILAEGNVRVGKYLKGTAIGDLEHRVAIRATHDHLPDLDAVTY
jgi:hypothetical protein